MSEPTETQKEDLRKANNLLKRLLDLLTKNTKSVQLVYLSPAEQLRRRADELEEESNLIKEVEEYLVKSNYYK